MIIRVGTRKGKLALIQTQLVINKIKHIYPEISCEIVPIMTTGDLIKDRDLSEIGGKALFLKEIEMALLDNKIDIAVHSLKDVPGRVIKGLIISSVLEREDERDVLISEKFKTIQELPQAAVVGTSSPRRKILLKRARPDLRIVTFRGNVDSRINKFMHQSNNSIEAIILAAAGLKRLGIFNSQYCHLLNTNEMLPAVGQGVIAIETREDDERMREIACSINHQPTWQLIQAERAFIEYLDASCQTPIAAHATYQGNNIKGEFMLSDPEGQYVFFHTEIGAINDHKNIGIKAAKAILRMIPSHLK